jgi:hypothetical protein
MGQREDADRPFGGNGSRYQNWLGRPAHWWNISFDTHSRAQRMSQGCLRVFYLVVIFWVVVATIIAVIRAH